MPWSTACGHRNVGRQRQMPGERPVLSVPPDRPEDQGVETTGRRSPAQHQGFPAAGGSAAAVQMGPRIRMDGPHLTSRRTSSRTGLGNSRVHSLKRDPLWLRVLSRCQGPSVGGSPAPGEPCFSFVVVELLPWFVSISFFFFVFSSVSQPSPLGISKIIGLMVSQS